MPDRPLTPDEARDRQSEHLRHRAVMLTLPDIASQLPIFAASFDALPLSDDNETLDLVLVVLRSAAHIAEEASRRYYWHPPSWYGINTSENPSTLDK